MNNFLVRIDKIKKQLGLSTVFEYQGHFKDEGIVFIGDLKLSAKITNTGEELLVQGKGQGEVELTCSRCLQTFSAPLAFEFCERFIPEEKLGETEPDADEEAANIFSYQGDKIDLKELIRQHSIIAVPFKPLCSAECRGFCPSCGRDLNLTPCDCRNHEANLRKSLSGKIKEAP